MIYPQPVRRHYHPKYTLITVDIMPRSKTSDKVLCAEREGGGGGVWGVVVETKKVRNIIQIIVVKNFQNGFFLREISQKY